MSLMKTARHLLAAALGAVLLCAAGCDDEPADWCPSWLDNCDGDCVALDADSNNCGECGNVCKSGELCINGKCGVACLGGTTACSGGCVDTQVDPKNCGACGTACKSEEVCSAGACGLTCVGGSTKCSGVCVDTQVDVKNCGSCGTACKSGEICEAGTCKLSCVGGSVACSGVCVDTQVDPKNCGSCGTACKSEEVCSAGTCGLTCVGGSTKCSGSCVDTQVDPKNCGSCGNACKTGDICSAGKCQGVCGDGRVGTGEVCDGTNLANETCKTQKFAAGTLACASGCAAFDTSGCTWALAATVTFSGEASSEAADVAVDGSGNVYVTGYYPDKIAFGALSLTSNGDDDVFVASLNQPPTAGWAVTAGGSSYDFATAIAADASGNSYVTGAFTKTASFGTIKLTAQNGGDVFVTKLDKAGKALWAVAGTASGSLDMGTGVGVDGSGNVYVVGEYEGTVSFGSTKLTSQGYSDIFVVKLGATGTVLWGVSIGGQSRDYSGRLAVDSAGNVTLVGTIRGAVTVDNTTLTPSGGSDALVVQLTSAGKVSWAVNLGGTGSETADGVALDGSGNVYVSGGFYNTMTVNQSNLTSQGSSDAFLVKLDKSGKALWAVSAGGTGADWATSVAVDSAGSPRLAGYFTGTATFGTLPAKAAGYREAFVARLSSTGAFAWVTASAGAGTSDSSRAYGLAVDKGGSSYLVGTFYDKVTFGSVTLTLTSMIPSPFVWKVDKSGN